MESVNRPSKAALPYGRIVVKLGTSTLTGGASHLSRPLMADLTRQMVQLREAARQVFLVTSGAIAVGRAHLGFPQLPKEIPAKQMLAAVGQPRLMALYEHLFGLYDVTVAQVLLTRADLADRRRYLNSRATLLALLSRGIIPIINENDTVAAEEIRVGDNDNLSALVANLIEADLLVLLTDQAGLYTADPRKDPSAQLIDQVATPEISESLWQAAAGTGNGLGVGGMFTKLQAADLARRSGATVIIARGSDPDVLPRIIAGELIGTRFLPVVTALESRKRYLLTAGRAPGCLSVDNGAVSALKHGASLLPVGVKSLSGAFDRGDVVRVADPSGREIARGLTNYSFTDLTRIRGRRSLAIEQILGYIYAEEVIHRNNMVLL